MPPEGPVAVEITGLRSFKGAVLACMTARADRFPDCAGDPDAYTLKVAVERGMVLDFGSVQPGRYAIAVVHDENGNGKVDRALGFIPREGFGFSRDAPVRMGPPRFSQAAFVVDATPARQSIHIRYIL